MNLIDYIEEEMRNDDEDREKESRRLVQDYEAASEAEKRAIDGALICLCGWSLPTLIEKADAREIESDMNCTR
jgi:hypothetical protein